jgi:hypothetical protein
MQIREGHLARSCQTKDCRCSAAPVWGGRPSFQRTWSLASWGQVEESSGVCVMWWANRRKERRRQKMQRSVSWLQFDIITTLDILVWWDLCRSSWILENMDEDDMLSETNRELGDFHDFYTPNSVTRSLMHTPWVYYNSFYRGYAWDECLCLAVHSPSSPEPTAGRVRFRKLSHKTRKRIWKVSI